MAEIPIINNLKNKFIPSHHQEDDEDIFGDEKQELGAVENDVLAQFRIQPHTELDNNVLTPSKIAKVQFNTSKPEGFSFKQVEAFYGAVLKSSEWYINALEKRDRDVHKLATEVDKYKTDYQNTRFQLEILQGVGGQALVDDTGNYVTESQLSDDQLKLVDLENVISGLRDDLLYERKISSELRDQIENQHIAAPIPVVISGTASDQDLVELNELRLRQQELDVWENDVTVEYGRLENELTETQQELASKVELVNQLNATINALENNSAGSEQQINSLTAQLNEAILERDDAIAELNNERAKEPTTVQDAEMVNKLASLESDIVTLNTTITGLQTQAREVEELKAKAKENDDYITELNTHIDALESDLERQAGTGIHGVTPNGIPGYRKVDGITAADLGLEE